MDAQLIIIGILWVKPNRKNHLSLYGLYELFAITDLLKFVFATIIHRVLFEINKDIHSVNQSIPDKGL